MFTFLPESAVQICLHSSQNLQYRYVYIPPRICSSDHCMELPFIFLELISRILILMKDKYLILASVAHIYSHISKPLLDATLITFSLFRIAKAQQSNTSAGDQIQMIKCKWSNINVEIRVIKYKWSNVNNQSRGFIISDIIINKLIKWMKIYSFVIKINFPLDQINS